MTDTDTQRQIFAQAVELLGGQGAAATALNINERTLRKLLAGDRELHAGFLEDTSKALLLHAAKIREVERRLNPGFSANLTDKQRSDPLHGNAVRNRAARQSGPQDIQTGPGGTNWNTRYRLDERGNLISPERED